MEIFRLKSLRIRDSEIFKKEIEFKFSQDSDGLSLEAPYFSLILGPNGTGKSNLLKFVIEIFRLAYEKKNNTEHTYYPNGKYFLEYQLGNSTYSILNTLGWEFGEDKPAGTIDNRGEKGIRFFRGGNEIEASQIEIPNSILASSIMLTDKYLFLRNPDVFPIYKYLGVRRDTNTGGTRSFIAKTIDHIFSASGKKDFIDSLKDMLHFLQLGDEFYISYSPKYKYLFFSGKLSVESFESFFLDYKTYLPSRTTEPWSVNTFKQLKSTEPDVIPKLVALLNYLSTKLENYLGSRAQYFEFNIFEIDAAFQDLFYLLPYLHSLNIISYPEITLNKNGYYGIGDSSSGEYHFISTIIAILSTISQNSIVMIDEPEISLHPNWQMKYMYFLNKLFKKYGSSHFIICSHSHFLVSDMKAENSTIISLAREEKGITAQTIYANTFGWSAEQILLEVFRVPTTRNYFIAEKVGEILELISKVDRNDELIKAKVAELLNSNIIELSEEDPLKPIVDKLITKYA